MANTIQLRILDNKQIKAEMQGIPLANENSYRIYADEENATQFEIVQKPTAYQNATYYVIFINSEGKRAFLNDVIPDPITEEGQEIIDDTFMLPKGMAVAGYGYIRIYCRQDDEKVEFQTIKVKVWETLSTYHNYVRPLETIASQEWVEENFLDISTFNVEKANLQAAINSKVSSSEVGEGANKIPRRNSAGNITTDTPTQLGEATNKAYVDNQVIGLEGVVLFKSQLGQPNGVAPLDAGGKLPAGLVPSIDMGEYIAVSSEAELQTIRAEIGDVAYLAETIDGKLTVTNSWWFVDIDTTQEPPFRIWAVLNTVYAENALLAQKANALMVSGNPKSGDQIQTELNGKATKQELSEGIQEAKDNANHSKEADLAKNVENDKGKMLDSDVVESEGTIYKDEAFTRRATAIPFSGETVTVANGVEEILKDQALSVNKNQYMPVLATGNGYANYNLATTITFNNGIATLTTSGGNGDIQNSNAKHIVGHKYLIIFDYYSTGTTIYVRTVTNSQYLENGTTITANVWTRYAKAYTANYEAQMSIVLANGSQIKNWMLIDLTQFFQSQPAMASCTAKWFLQNYPEYTSYVAYNAGTLEDTPSYKYVTTNENLWDEEVELGTLDVNDGSEVSGTSNLRSKNFIPVFPSATYYFLSPTNMRVFEYDENKSFIKVNSAFSNNTLQLQPSTTFIKFFLIQGYGTTYKNDIQICNHFSDQDVENTYHPHQEWERNVDWSWTSTGKGKSAGAVRDTKDYVNRKNIEKVGQRDLRTLTFVQEGTYWRAAISNAKRSTNNIVLSSNYQLNTNAIYAGQLNNMEYKLFDAQFCIRNDSITQASEIVGMLNYELATYIETDMSESEVNTTTESDYGNEVKVPLSSDDFMSGSFTTIFYQDNVLRQIYNNKDAIEQNAQDIDDILDGAKQAGRASYSENANHAIVADNMTPYSENSGVTQENPFISQGTGTNNNVQIVTTGNVCEIKSKNDNAVVYNQKTNHHNFDSDVGWSGSFGTISVSGNKCTYKVTTVGDNYQNRIVRSGNYGFNGVKNHKYWVMITAKPLTRAYDFYFLSYNNTTQATAINFLMGNISQNVKGTLFGVSSANGTGIFDIRACFGSNSKAVDDEIELYDICVIDLTQWFNGDDNIPADLLANPSHFSWYYNGSLAYDTGSLQNCNGRYLECGQGRNLFDQQTELGSILDNGTYTPSGTHLCSKNPIIVVPNTKIYIWLPNYQLRVAYYDINGTCVEVRTNIARSYFDVPANAHTMRFMIWSDAYGTTYKGDISIELYYTPEQGGEGYGEMHDYVAPIRIDTGNETLLAFDKKLPSGVIERNTIELDLGSLNWMAGTPFFYANVTDIAMPTNAYNVKCANYVVGDVSSTSTDDMVIAFPAAFSSQLRIIDKRYSSATELKAALNGVMAYVESANPTTEQGTAFSEYAPINDYSYMAWLDTDGNLVSIPQGCKLFYPVDYKGFLDDGVMYTDGDFTSLAKNEDITDAALNARGYYKMQDLLTAFGANGMVGGTLRNVLAEKFSSDFANTICIDLGDYNWSYNSTDKVFFVDITSINPSVADNGTHFVSTLYKARYQTLANLNDLEGRVLESGANKTIYFKNLSYTDTDIFKVNMKGVLVALEKA